MSLNAYLAIPNDFTGAPSLSVSPSVSVVAQPSADVDVIAWPLRVNTALPADIGADWDALERHGFSAKSGQTFVNTQFTGPNHVLVGLGDGQGDESAAAMLRNAVGAVIRSSPKAASIAFAMGDQFDLPAAELGTIATEAAGLARYAYTALKSKSKHVALSSFEIVTTKDPETVESGIAAGLVMARTANIARDLANTPPGHLNAVDLAELAVELAPRFGLEVEIADKAKLLELRCGGLLGVNAGSVQEPRMITLKYTPANEPTGHVALVGKGIMYDSGGISLKPSDPMHLMMKMDMAGAGAVFGAMTALKDLNVSVAVTAYLMCTDNMPSGTATKLGDVLTIRNGTTVEVKNTDAEGRLVLSDGLCLANEQSPDAIIDIATLTGAALMALGTSTAAAFGNDQKLVEQVIAAGTVTDEPAWQLPLDKSYRTGLDSEVADISNVGGRFAGATTAALFLSEFVGTTPWVHLDIAGTMHGDKDHQWRSKGATGYGARLLASFLSTFSK